MKAQNMTTYRSTKDIAATVRESLKRELPGWKFSVTTKVFGWSSSITVALVSGPESVIEGYAPGTNGVEWGYPVPGYAQLNHYSFLVEGFSGSDSHTTNGYQLTEAGWEVMAKAAEILAREHWDKSDIQTDYFNCAYYMHLNVGRWDKNYEVRS